MTSRTSSSGLGLLSNWCAALLALLNGIVLTSFPRAAVGAHGSLQRIIAHTAVPFLSQPCAPSSLRMLLPMLLRQCIQYERRQTTAASASGWVLYVDY